ETPGILLPNHSIVVELEVAGQFYEVVRSSAGVAVTAEGESGPAALDIRALVAPRILSQRQIARIARDPAAQRRELAALLDLDAIRDFSARRRDASNEMERLQTRRRDLQSRVGTLPALETELRAVRDQIRLLERGGNQEILARFTALQSEERWIDGAIEAVD